MEGIFICCEPVFTERKILREPTFFNVDSTDWLVTRGTRSRHGADSQYVAKDSCAQY